ncbi:MAG: cobalt ABC transporter permease [Nitriliruptorales bacterium]|nr:cobalt ABC transporter permease [Nitriliruptorales bacterium]
MHIPDGFINLPTAAATSVASAGGVAYALRVARTRLLDRQIPLVGVTAAFVFAVQMINFPVLPGVSGHLIGGALAAILLGPWLGCLVLATVLMVQAIGFADGGITALGANISLMALITAAGGHYLFRALTAVLPRGHRSFIAATAITAWTTVFVASGLAALYITYGGFAGAQQAAVIIPVMLAIHAAIGVGEAFITTAVVMAVLSARPDLVANADRLQPAERRRTRTSSRALVAGGIVAAFIAAVGLSSFASSQPDGLEATVMRTQCTAAADPAACLEAAASDPVFTASPLPDYSVPWVAGFVGVVACLAVGAGWMRTVRRRPQPTPVRPREREPSLR